MDKAYLGLTDVYASKDIFGIQRYIEGLTSFIHDCSMPMTISIQGDWGTGKTSIMHMVEDSLDKKRVVTQWFNTWQYSQFDLGNNLGISLLYSLLNSMDDSEEDVQTVKATLGKISRKAARLAKAAIEDQSNKFLGETVTGEIKETGKAIFANDNVLFEDPTQSIVDLKNQFHTAVKTTLQKANKEKMVVFIDDLDRLQPARAIELLEVMKIFLDSENCVFVLAIDYSVVIKGVKVKYGDDFDEKKGRAYFDKIIQVPFRVPVVDYDISSFIKECLKDIGVEQIDDDTISNYEDLVAVSVGRNPRAIKRTFNAYMLLLRIAGRESIDSAESKLLLFAILCMQNQFESVYNSVMLYKNDITPETIDQLRRGDKQLLEQYLVEDEDEFKDFMEVFCDILESGENGEINEKQITLLKKVLEFSAYTASTSVNNQKSNKVNAEEFIGLHQTDENREIVAETVAWVDEIKGIRDIRFSKRAFRVRFSAKTKQWIMHFRFQENEETVIDKMNITIHFPKGYLQLLTKSEKKTLVNQILIQQIDQKMVKVWPDSIRIPDLAIDEKTIKQLVYNVRKTVVPIWDSEEIQEAVEDLNKRNNG